ncbi:MAG: hypothetical protein WBE48_20145, partial [Xanthobacteraceae bacterium]
MLGFRLIVLLATALAASGIVVARGDLVTQALAAPSTTATSSDPVPLPTARPGSKDNKAAGKTSAKSDIKSGGTSDVKASSNSSSKTSAKSTPKPSTQTSAATKLSTEKPGAHKPLPPMRGTLA